MKILHICLISPFTDGLGYQENMMVKYGASSGNDMYVLTYHHKTVPENERKRESYENEYGAHIIRISEKRVFLKNRLVIFESVQAEIERILPDIIFVHGTQFLDMSEVVKYKKNHPDVCLYADNHADLINSCHGFFSKNILHKIIWKQVAKKAEKYIETFFGVLPARCDFLADIYGIDKEKIELLKMGADDSEIDFSKKEEIRNKIRRDYSVGENDFLVVTGGRLEQKKNIGLLADVVSKSKKKNIKLLLFGKPVDEETEREIEIISKNNRIIYIGWIASEKVYDYFFAAELVFFPGRHSVLWEQAVGAGAVCAFNKWKGMEHFNVNDNCIISDFSKEENIKNVIEKMAEDKIYYKRFAQRADEVKTEFWYSKIADRIIKK